jgi:hypothetical protein
MAACILEMAMCVPEGKSGEMMEDLAADNYSEGGEHRHREHDDGSG